MLRSVRRAASAAAFALLCACTASPVQMPANATVGPLASAPVTTPMVLANDVPPRMLAMRFTSLDVARGTRWAGAFVTSTNVASVEVRTPLFSIDVPRTSYGRFAFDVDVVDLPPIFVRGYTLEVLARNSAGAIAAEELPFRIR